MGSATILSALLVTEMHARRPDFGVRYASLLIGAAHGFGVGSPKEANHAASVTAQKAFDIFRAVKVETPAGLPQRI